MKFSLMKFSTTIDFGRTTLNIDIKKFSSVIFLEEHLQRLLEGGF